MVPLQVKFISGMSTLVTAGPLEKITSLTSLSLSGNPLEQPDEVSTAPPPAAVHEPYSHNSATNLNNHAASLYSLPSRV